METLSWFVGGVIAVLAIPTFNSVMVEGGNRGRWELADFRETDLKLEGQGAFREATVRATVPLLKRDRAPAGLRVMAFSCWFLGQMVIPGFLAWCVGLLMLGEARFGHDPVGLALMASFFPGAWCAWLLWRAGSSLVRGEREPADRATRRAAVVIVGYNAVVIVASLAWLIGHRGVEVLLGCVAYAIVSIVHVVAVRAAFLAHQDRFPEALTGPNPQATSVAADGP